MEKNSIYIRETNASDFQDIFNVEEKAFGYEKEAILTAELLSDDSAQPILSFLAFDDNKAIGHILFTRAYLENKEEQPLYHILAPLAVIPEYQNKGIGGKLIIEGIKRLKDMGSELIFVLGHIEYYPKFGFIPDAKKLGFPAPYPIPAEFKDAWMVKSTNDMALTKYEGKVICADMLNKPEHWRE